jgi:hypothetical protein
MVLNFNELTDYVLLSKKAVTKGRLYVVDLIFILLFSC